MQQASEDDRAPVSAQDTTLSTNLCFSLYAATNRLSRVYGAFLEPFGLTFPQTLALMALWEHAPRTVGDIARTLEIDNGTITPILKRLEGAGFVRRIRDTADERRVLVHITDKGRAVRQPVLEARRAMLGALAVSDDKLLLLKGVIDQIATRIDAVPAATRGPSPGAEAVAASVTTSGRRRDETPGRSLEACGPRPATIGPRGQQA